MNPWFNPPEITPEMEAIVDDYLASKGLGYYTELYIFMVETELKE